MVFDLSKWNKKIYRNEDDSFFSGEKLTAKELWGEFQIKSAPEFRESCYSHIPDRWADDVRKMLQEIKALDEQVEITQVKEKWCRLTVYYNAPSEEIRRKVSKIIVECMGDLVSKGLHPPIQTSKSQETK